MRWFLVFFVLISFPFCAFAKEEKIESPLENNPELAKQLKLEVYRLVSQALTFSKDDLFERIHKNIDDYTLQGCETALMTIYLYDLEEKIRALNSYVMANGIWIRKVGYEPLEQIGLDYAGEELGYRRVWLFSLPISLVIPQGLHKRKYSMFVVGKILEKEKDSSSYRLHLIFPINEQSSTKGSGRWKKKHPKEELCEKWQAFDKYTLRNVGSFRTVEQ